MAHPSMAGKGNVVKSGEKKAAHRFLQTVAKTVVQHLFHHQAHVLPNLYDAVDLHQIRVPDFGSNFDLSLQTFVGLHAKTHGRGSQAKMPVGLPTQRVRAAG